MAGEEWLHEAGQAGDRRAKQWRIVDGRGDDAKAGFVWRDSLRIPAAGHDSLSKFSGGAILGPGIWLFGGCKPVPFSVCVLAVSPCGAGNEISGDTFPDGRQRHACGSPSCAEDDGTYAGGTGRG